MSAQRLREKYKSRTLQPHQSSQDADLIGLMAANGVRGTVFHVLDHITEQFEDIYTMLVDDRSVVTFEVPRTAGTLSVEEFCVSPVAQYRNELGQGKSRMRLDRAAEDARKFLMR